MDNNFYLFLYTYNHEEYIDMCLRSAIFQTKKFKRIVIYDDFSTDNTFKILQKYSYKYEFIELYSNKVKTYHEDIKKIINYFNKYDHNDYFSIISGDDLLELNFVEENNKSIKKNNHIKIFFSSVHIINSKNHYINKVNNYKETCIYKKNNNLYKSILYNTEINSVPFVYNVDCILKNSLLFQDINSSYDYETLINISRKFDIFYTNKFLSYWRRHDKQESFTKRLSQYKSDYITFLKQKIYHHNDKEFNYHNTKFYRFRNYLLCIKHYENKNLLLFLKYFIKSLFSNLSPINFLLIIMLIITYPLDKSIYKKIKKKYLFS